MGNLRSVPSQVAVGCCCEKTAVYNVRRGSWASPFTGTGEFLAVSDLFARSSAAPPRGEMPTVVLVGGTGVGKSNLGNYILGSNAFESRNSQESVTAVTSWIDGAWFGGRHPVRVVDCTGIGDTKGAHADQKQWDTTIEVLQKVGKVSIFVMVMRAGRFTKFDKEVIGTLRESFGPTFWKNMCVFCTGANAKPAQLDLDSEGPKIRRKLHQIEKEQGGNEAALQAIHRVQVYSADLDPTLACPKSRSLEFKFKPSLAGLSLEELLSLDLRIPHNVMEMTGEEFHRFAGSDLALERWIEGNYFQLGLSRLAAFKTDVIAMEAFYPEQVARLADAPETEKPPPESADDGDTRDQDASEYFRYFTELESLENALVWGDVVLVKGSWLESVAASGEVLPRRQQIPDRAIWDVGALIDGLQGGTEAERPSLVSISYSWLSANHPDPDGFHLKRLGPMLKAHAKWNRIGTADVAVFLDWCSLHQQPRSEEEEEAFARAMQHAHLWYAHRATNVWLLSATPAAATKYQDRGWPYFEKATGMMLDESEPILDLGLARSGWTSWGQVLQDCRIKPMPPLAPETFAGELAQKVFSASGDREMLVRRYEEAFRGAIASTERLMYGGLRWGDREAIRVSNLLPLCSCLRELELQQNEITNRGAVALAASLSRCPSLERLSVWGNCIDDPAATEALWQAWIDAGKTEVGLEMGDQRHPAPAVEKVAAHIARGLNPDSPSGVLPRIPSTPTRAPARRTPDEMAALQISELSARQAAFEARLHVAINRISGTLAEVGDAVGSPVPVPSVVRLQTAPPSKMGL